MAWTPGPTVTGAPNTGLTTPTYTLSLDKAPTYLGIQHAVTSLGGTQTGVSTNSPLLPFTVNLIRPASLKQLAAIRTGSNQLLSNNRNKWRMVFRKGCLLAASPVYGQANVGIDFDLPAGMEVTASPELRALMSLIGGILNSNAVGLTDSFATGVV